METGVYRVSIIPAEVDDKGNPKYDGYPVFMSKESLEKKKKKQANNYYAQMLQIPLQAGAAALKLDWLLMRDYVFDDGRYYILCDAASNPELAKRPDKIDYSCFWLIKSQPGRKIKIIDMVRDKLSISEKWKYLKQWHMEYLIDTTAYEEYGPQKDREYFLMRMEEEGFYFDITPLREKKESKEDRIGILAEFFAEGKIILPKSLTRLTKAEGVLDLVQVFIDEYSKYPLVEHDDMLDSLSKFTELEIIYPEVEEDEMEEPIRYQGSPLEDEDTEIVECFWGGL
jgi:predicted phage terminase large subunit-like protein